jgi:hypothetical protein
VLVFTARLPAGTMSRRLCQLMQPAKSPIVKNAAAPLKSTAGQVDLKKG